MIMQLFLQEERNRRKTLIGVQFHQARIET
jgi:hypothetical protein